MVARRGWERGPVPCCERDERAARPPTGDHQGRPYISWRCVMSLRETIESYHELLTDELAGESQEKLDDQQQSRGITFGGRPLCSVLRPRFMTPEQYRFL